MCTQGRVEVTVGASQVGPRRWKVEAYAAQNAVLMLSSINLPGGVQVRWAAGACTRAKLTLVSRSGGNSSRMSYRCERSFKRVTCSSPRCKPSLPTGP